MLDELGGELFLPLVCFSFCAKQIYIRHESSNN